MRIRARDYSQAQSTGMRRAQKPTHFVLRKTVYDKRFLQFRLPLSHGHNSGAPVHSASASTFSQLAFIGTHERQITAEGRQTTQKLDPIMAVSTLRNSFLEFIILGVLYVSLNFV